MYSKTVAFLAVALAVIYFSSATVIVPRLGSDPVVPPVIRATPNCTVPSVDYIVNAIQSLKTAMEISPDEANVAKMYSALMKTKYPAHNWDVAVGYTTLYLNSSAYVEAIVTSGGKQVQGMLKSDKKKGVLYMIFSTN